MKRFRILFGNGRGKARFAVLFLLSLFFSGSSLFAAVSNLEGSGKIDDPYLIKSIEDFNEFLGEYIDKKSNQYNTYTYFRLEADLDFSNYKNLVPIGGFWISFGNSIQGGNTRPFYGSFDGNGKKVLNIPENAWKGYTIDCKSGFFGVVGKSSDAAEKSVIKNLTFENCNFSFASGKSSQGGVCGQAFNTEIRNCNVIDSKVVGNTSGAGGICANLNKSSVESCAVIRTEILCAESGGGIVSVVEGNSSVNNSFFSGSIEYKNGVAGGVVAKIIGSNVSISCSGASFEKISYKNISNKIKNIAGLVGTTQGSVNKVVVENCFANGEIYAYQSDIGALTGAFCGTISNSYFAGLIDAYKKENNDNLTNGVALKDCISSSASRIYCNSDVFADGLIPDNSLGNGYMAEEKSKLFMQSGCFAELLNEYQAGLWVEDIYNYNNGYPFPKTNVIASGKVFAEASCHPIVRTDSVDGVTSNSASLYGSFAMFSGQTITSMGFEFKKASESSWSDKPLSKITEADKLISKDIEVTGLQFFTDYQFRAYIVYEGVKYYGAIVDFKTKDFEPVGGFYLINSKDYLDFYTNLINTFPNWSEGKKFKLMVDIAEPVTAMIGTETNPFKGSFYGEGHYVNLAILDAVAQNVGFFAVVESASGNVIENLDVKGSVSGGNSAGALIGKVRGTGSITVSSCCNAATVSGAVSGGILGSSECGSLVLTNCVNIGTVSGTQYVGGIAGKTAGLVTLSMNAGRLIGNGTQNIGGIAGEASSVTYCENVGQALYNFGAATNNSYYHKPLSVTTNQGSSKTLEQLVSETPAAFAFYKKSGFYPVPSLVKDRQIAKLASVPVVLSTEQQTVMGIKDEIVLKEVTVDNSVSCSWGFVDPLSSNLFYKKGDVYVPQQKGSGVFVVMSGDLKREIAFEVTDVLFSGGIGTEDVPYLISNKEDMVQLAGKVNANLNWSASKHFLVTNDIDGVSTIVGIETSPFKGVFNGNGKTITVNIDSPGDCVGVFGCIDSPDAKVMKLMVNGSVSGNDNVGSVCGNLKNGKIEECNSAANVSGNENVGGICGASAGSVQTCINIGRVSGSVSGGICGYATGEFNTVVNSGIVSGNDYVAGIVGKSGADATEIFGAVNVAGVNSGGQKDAIVNGSISSSSANLFYDSQTSLAASSTSAIGLATKDFLGDCPIVGGGTNFSCLKGLYPYAIGGSGVYAYNHLSTCAVLLEGGNTLSSVTRDFKLANRDGFDIVWSASNDKVKINSDNTVEVKSAGTVTLTCSIGNVKREIEVVIPCVPVYSSKPLEGCDFIDYNGKHITSDTAYTDTIVGIDGCLNIQDVTAKVKKSVKNTVKHTACRQFVLNGTKVTESNTISDTLVASSGCDSIVVHEITIHKPLESNVDLLECNPFEYTLLSGDKVKLSKDTSFVDSVMMDGFACPSKVNYVNVSIGRRDSVININGCGFVDYDGVQYTESTVLTKNLTRKHVNCDSVVTVNINVVPQTVMPELLESCDFVEYTKFDGEVVFIEGEGAEKTFDDKKIDAQSGCATVIKNVTLRVKGMSLSADDNEKDVVASGCDIVVYKNKRYTQTSVLEERYQRYGSNCDSIVAKVVEVKKSSIEERNVHGCESVEYTCIDGTVKKFTESTVYKDVVKGVSYCGCDSGYVVNVVVHKVKHENKKVEGCDLVSYKNGRGEVLEFVRDTVINDTLKSKCDLSCGCDSVIYSVNVKVNKSTPSDEIQPKVIIGCESVAYTSLVPGSEEVVYTENTSFDERLTNQFGCDSIVPVKIIVNKNTYGEQLIHACEKFEYIASNGVKEILERDRVINDVLKNSVGCDSLLTLDVRVHKVNLTEVEQEGCDNVEYVKFDGTTDVFEQSKVFYDTLKSVECNCDSIVRKVSVVVHKSTPSEEIEEKVINACDRFVYTNFAGEEIVFEESGVYSDNMVNFYGCDSIVPVRVNISKSSAPTHKVVHVCDAFEHKKSSGEVIMVEPGRHLVFEDTLLNASGCDSVIVYDVWSHKADIQVHPTVVGCDVATYSTLSGNEMVFERDTMFIEVLKSEVCDCDSIVRTVSVKLSHSTPEENIDTVYVSGCNEVVYRSLTENREMTFTDNDVYYEHFLNKAGCDSIVPVKIVVNKPSNTRIYKEECVMWKHVDNMNVSHIFDEDTVYVDDTYVNEFGCDSIVTYDVKIIPQKFDTLHFVGCDSVDVEGKYYKADSTWKVVPMNICDVVKVYSVKINPSYQDTIEVSGCDSVERFGVTYTKSSVLVENYQSVHGCDSTVVVNVNVLPSQLKTMYMSSCEFVEYNGKVYRENVRLQETYVNDYGCESPLVVEIEVLPPLYSEDTIKGCGEVVFNGVTYEESTVVYDTLTSIVTGCDSIVTRNIEVNYPVYTHVVLDSCNSITYKGIVYTDSTVLKTDTLKTIHGCDSIVDVTLNVKRCFPFPVIVNKYNWILVCNNSMIEEGGFSYSAYQWYKDGVMVPGADKSFFTENKELDGCYQVFVTLDDNVTTLRSEITCVEAERRFSLSPNPVNKFESVFITFDMKDEELLDGAYIEVFNALGIKIRQSNVVLNKDKQYELKGINVSGTYFVKINLKDETSITARFIVK